MTLQVRYVVLEDRYQRLVAQGAVRDDGVDPVHELRREMTPNGTQSHPLQMCRELRSGSPLMGVEAQPRLDLGQHVAGTEITREEDDRLLEIHFRPVTEPQGRLVEHAEQQLGERRGGFFYLVEEDQGKITPVAGRRVQDVLCQPRLRLRVPHVPGWGADELGHLVLVLELTAVDLHDSAHVPVEHLGQRLHGAGLAGAGRPEKEEYADRPAVGREARLMELNARDDVFQRMRLPDDFARKDTDQLVGPARALDVIAGHYVFRSGRVISHPTQFDSPSRNYAPALDDSCPAPVSTLAPTKFPHSVHDPS